MPSTVVGLNMSTGAPAGLTGASASSCPAAAQHQVGAEGHDGFGVHLDVGHLGQVDHFGGYSSDLFTPTTRSPTPRAKRIWVAAGEADTMRVGFVGIVTVLPCHR